MYTCEERCAPMVYQLVCVDDRNVEYKFDHALWFTQRVPGGSWFGEPGPQEGEAATGFVFDKNFIVSDYPKHIKPLHDRLDALEPVIQTPEGHKLAMDEMGNILVKTVKTKTTADYYYVAESAMVLPHLLLELTFRSGLVFSTLWKKIIDDEKRLAEKKAALPAKKATAKKPVKKIAKLIGAKKR